MQPTQPTEESQAPGTDTQAEAPDTAGEQTEPAPPPDQQILTPPTENDTDGPADGGDVSESAEAPAAGPDGKGFRETLWFMEAQRPEGISKIEEEDITDRTSRFEEDENSLDTGVRRRFSLNVTGEHAVRDQEGRIAKAIRADQSGGGGGGLQGKAVGIVLVMGVIAAVLYFMFAK